MRFAKKFFDLQFAFAEKLASLCGMPLERALLEYTNYFVRFGLGREFDSESDGWRNYVAGLRTTDDRHKWTYDCYLRNAEANTLPRQVGTFGCFSYTMLGDSTVRLHFRNVESDNRSPLAAAQLDNRVAELTALFSHLRSTTEHALEVRGVSWLYNLASYRRLFPPAYAELSVVARCRFQSMTLWGQLLDYHGEVKGSMELRFVDSLAALSTLDSAEDCFPFQVLSVHSPLQLFYDFYRC